MTQEQFLFEYDDRIQKIRQINGEFNLEQNGYLAFSGGKDSTVLHYMLDKALPNNKIPRVYANTGIDFIKIQQFCYRMSESDSRFKILLPTQSLSSMFERVGYPFKSKWHSHMCDVYSRQGKSGCVLKYAEPKQNTPHSCPKVLQHQFNEPLPFKISDKCCAEMKKKPFREYEKASGRYFGITGMRRAEKGLRENLPCLSFVHGKPHRFSPLAPCSDEFIDFFIEWFGIQLCELYYPPYNFKRTGCVGCPYNIKLQEELDILERLLPSEKSRCEFIWKKVYSEYRKLHYRLRSL